MRPRTGVVFCVWGGSGQVRCRKPLDVSWFDTDFLYTPLLDCGLLCARELVDHPCATRRQARVKAPPPSS